MRPRPVRLAWSSSPTTPPSGPAELIAKRCPAAPAPLPRPPLLPSRGVAMGVTDVGPAMSRQQLAERLRRAWQDRRPSLDIFLASTEPHEDDDDDVLSVDEPVTQPVVPG